MLFNRASEICIHDESKIYVHMEIGRGDMTFPVFPLLDTGATGTMFPKEYARLLGIDYRQGRPRKINGIASHLNGRVHKVEAVLIDDNGGEVGRHMIDATFVEGSDLSIVGMNFLTKFDWRLVFSEKRLEVESA